MILGLCLICVVTLGWAIAVVAARPPGPDARRRDYDRRLRRVYRDPDLVNLLDVENLLLADGIPDDAVARVLHRADAHRIGARTMWRWTDRHGSRRLVDALDAGLSEDTMLDHLDAGTAPEWHSISVFADLANDTLPAGMPLDELVDLDAVPTLGELTFPADLDDWTTHTIVDEELADFDSLPPITDPGFGPFSPAEALAETQSPDDEDVETDSLDPVASDDRKGRKDQEGGGDWPAVA